MFITFGSYLEYNYYQGGHLLPLPLDQGVPYRLHWGEVRVAERNQASFLLNANTTDRKPSSVSWGNTLQRKLIVAQKIVKENFV